jgi:hypothetical protein
MKSSSYKPLFLLFALVIISWIAAGFTAYHFFATWGERGTFGDMFGAVNALFSGLAFAGIIYAIFLQRKELELQREELMLTREELRKSASAQSDQVNLMKDSAQLFILSSALNAFCQTAASSASSNPGGTTHIQTTKRRDELLSIVDKLVKSRFEI